MHFIGCKLFAYYKKESSGDTLSACGTNIQPLSQSVFVDSPNDLSIYSTNSKELELVYFKMIDAYEIRLYLWEKEKTTYILLEKSISPLYKLEDKTVCFSGFSIQFYENNDILKYFAGNSTCSKTPAIKFDAFYAAVYGCSLKHSKNLKISGLQYKIDHKDLTRYKNAVYKP